MLRISENEKKVALASLSRRCGRQTALPSFGGRCLCHLTGDPILSTMNTFYTSELFLLSAP
eukprot:4687464-Amphidinium_carterae.1